jgi:hypothetical protein
MSARDLAIDELVSVLGLPRERAAAVVDRLTHAAAVEAGHRTSEALAEPLAIAARKHSEGVVVILERAHRELNRGS